LRHDRRAIIICTHNLLEAEWLADTIAIIRKGRIIASGTTDALKDQLLGPAQMELRLAAPLNGLAENLSDLVTVLERGENWLRYFTARPEEVNPRLLAQLSGAGVPVLTLSEAPRSLEAVYLRAVEEDEK